MATLQEVKDKVTSLKDDVAESKTVIDSTKVLLAGLSAMIAELKSKLAEAIASGNPAELQAVLDEVTAVGAAIDSGTGELAAAVTANTPVAEASSKRS